MFNMNLLLIIYNFSFTNKIKPATCSLWYLDTENSLHPLQTMVWQRQLITTFISMPTFESPAPGAYGLSNKMRSPWGALEFWCLFPSIFYPFPSISFCFWYGVSSSLHKVILRSKPHTTSKAKGHYTLGVTRIHDTEKPKIWRRFKRTSNIDIKF